MTRTFHVLEIGLTLPKNTTSTAQYLFVGELVIIQDNTHQNPYLRCSSGKDFMSLCTRE
jgi:hypothetical protein